MKITHAIALVLTLSTPFSATPVWAGAIASLWNGQSFSLPQTTLIQDADSPSMFYWMPYRYTLAQSSEAVLQPDGSVGWVTKPVFTNTVDTIEGHKMSVYNFRVRLENISQLTQARAEAAIRRHFGMESRLAGMVPVCGMQAAVPTVVGTGPAVAGTGRVTMGFSSSDAGTCTTAHGAEAFDVEVAVPFEAEPSVAKSFITGSAIPLPAVRLLHPYKYIDKAELDVDAQEFVRYFKVDGSISGNIKFVQLGLSAKLTEMLQRFSSMGLMHFDIQSRDPEVRARYTKILKEALENTFFKFVPSTLPPITGPSGPSGGAVGNVGTSGGGGTPWNVSASLNLDEQTAQRIQTIKLKLEDVQYGTITSDAEIYVPAVPAEVIAPAVRALIKE